VLDDAAQERLVSRFGDGARAWCAALPGVVERCCSRWDLRLEDAQSGSTSRIYCGRQGGRREVVLKLTPDPAIAREEAVALRAWAASPRAVTLLDTDLGAGALLLERLRPGIKLRDASPPPAAREMAELLTGLRVEARELSGQLPSLGQRIEFIFNLIRKRRTSPRVAGLVDPELVIRGYELAQTLARGAPTELVHGDLHFANILIAGSPPSPRCLVAIDPRPCLGDPAFDAVDWVLWPRDRDEVAHRIRELCGLIPSLDADRLWSWCRASAVIIAVQRPHHRPTDATIPFLLELAALARSPGQWRAWPTGGTLSERSRTRCGSAAGSGPASRRWPGGWPDGTG
jgi:streptomycin 6-kinase